MSFSNADKVGREQHPYGAAVYSYGTAGFRTK